MLTLLALAAQASTMLTDPSGSSFASDVAAAGDVDGDGYDDVLVGALTGGPADEGQVHLYRGSAMGVETTPSATLTGPATGSWFGFAASAAGDVNGDGYADVVAGGWLYDGDRGYAAIYLGSALGLSTTPSTVIEGLVAGDRLGYTVQGVGDLNADGYGDVAIGAPGDPMTPGFPGRVEIWAGSASGILTPGWDLLGEDDGSSFGAAVVSADLDADGHREVAVGAEGQGGYAGAVYVFGGSTGGPRQGKFQRIDGRFANDFFGGDVVAGGDIDADGYPDLVVRDRADTEAHVTVLAGSATGVVFAQNLVTDELVSSIGGGGDVNLDGYADVIVGWTSWSLGAGRALLYPGSPSFLAEASRAIVGDGGDALGETVAGVRDVDGDGFADFVAAAQGPGADGLSSVHVIYGYFALDLSVGSSPGTVTAYLGNAAPGDEYVVYLAPGPVAAGACPDPLGGLCFDMKPARDFGSAIANYTGGASVTRAVPAGVAPGTLVTLQTVVTRDHGWQEIEISRPISTTVTP